jgi:dihydroneopterin aldolase/2-amino-4-hydroxy-6-hydroxymethyldihydropteridine diphosphokinase
MNIDNQDYIKITNLKIFAHHGVFEEEKRNGQDFYINAKLYLDLHTPGKSDDLTESLHYGDCCHFMTKAFTEKSYDLIEAACENLCQRLLLEFDGLQAVEVELQKPHAPIGLPFENVSVNMYRKWHKAYISFGSNMGDKKQLILEGIDKLKNHPLIRDVKVSQMITTKPYGPVEQDDFLNGCLVLDTILNQEELIELLQANDLIGTEATTVADIGIDMYCTKAYTDKKVNELENIISNMQKIIDLLLYKVNDLEKKVYELENR